MNIIITFIILSIINVITSTIRSITTIKSGKVTASLISGAYFAFYNVILIYSVAEFNLIIKCIITFVCNVVGVFIVKYIEEKRQKTILWKIEITSEQNITNELQAQNLQITEYKNNNYFFYNVYCYTKEETEKTKKILKANYPNLKYIVLANNGNLF